MPVIIKCTAKLQTEMKLAKTNLVVNQSGTALLGDWHANLIYINRRKFILFVNDKTLFNFIACDLNRAEIVNLAVLFKNYLQCILAEEDIPEQILNSILSDCSEISYAKTDNKKILGSMNDLAFHYKHRILNAGSVHSPLIPEIIKKINRMPMGAINYGFPIDRLRELYGLERIEFSLKDFLNFGL